MTDRFVTAAELMSRNLGAADHPFLTIPHPISSATANDLTAAAHTAAAKCAAIVTANPVAHSD